jgi:hypothetical protein
MDHALGRFATLEMVFATTGAAQSSVPQICIYYTEHLQGRGRAADCVAICTSGGRQVRGGVARNSHLSHATRRILRRGYHQGVVMVAGEQGFMQPCGDHS